MSKKIIFITGAGRGIGKATAQHFAKEGWYVGLSDINQQEIEGLAQELRYQSPTYWSQLQYN